MARSSASVCLGCSKVMEMSLKAQRSFFHSAYTLQREAMVGQFGWHWENSAILFNFYTKLPVDVNSFPSIARLKYYTIFSQNCYTFSFYFQSKGTQLMANLYVSLRAMAIASFFENFQSIIALSPLSLNESTLAGLSIFLPYTAITLISASEPYQTMGLSLENSGYMCYSFAQLWRAQQKENFCRICQKFSLQRGERPWLRESTYRILATRERSQGRSDGAGFCDFLRIFLLRMDSSMLSLSICMRGEAEVTSKLLLIIDCLIPSRSLPERHPFNFPSNSPRKWTRYLQVFLKERSRMTLSNSASKIRFFWSGSTRSKIGEMLRYSDSKIAPLPLGLYNIRKASRMAVTSSVENFISQKNSIRCFSGYLLGKFIQNYLHPSEDYRELVSSTRSDAISAWERVAHWFLFMKSCSLVLISLVPSFLMDFSRSQSLTLNRFSTRYAFHSNLLPLLKAWMMSSIYSAVIYSFDFLFFFSRQQSISRAVSTCCGLSRSILSRVFLRQQRSTSSSLLASSFSNCSDNLRQKWSKNLICVLSS